MDEDRYHMLTKKMKVVNTGLWTGHNSEQESIRNKQGP